MSAIVTTGVRLVGMLSRSGSTGRDNGSRSVRRDLPFRFSVLRPTNGSPPNRSPPTVPVINILRPASVLMARLTYTRKFALIGLVLLVPAVLALHAYWTQQGSQIAFSAKERVGMVYLKPANELVVKLVQARGAAVRGEAVPSLDEAIASVDAA